LKGRSTVYKIEKDDLEIKFPVIGLGIPVPGNKFPVSLSRELLDK
jgi:hypothetical protein